MSLLLCFLSFAGAPSPSGQNQHAASTLHNVTFGFGLSTKLAHSSSEDVFCSDLALGSCSARSHHPRNSSCLSSMSTVLALARDWDILPRSPWWDPKSKAALEDNIQEPHNFAPLSTTLIFQTWPLKICFIWSLWDSSHSTHACQISPQPAIWCSPRCTRATLSLRSEYNFSYRPCCQRLRSAGFVEQQTRSASGAQGCILQPFTTALEAGTDKAKIRKTGCIIL